MKALIVIETCFGNTDQITQAVAEGLQSRQVEVQIVQASAAADISLEGIDLLLIGSPTHAMGLPKLATRQQAQSKGGTAPESGVSEWLDSVSAVEGRRVVAFSTVTGGIFSGSAAKVIEKRLRGLGVTVAAREDFRVGGIAGPLAEGELRRAKQWGASLG